MKRSRTFLENLTTTQYKQLLKLMPDMHKEKNKAITMLIFTFIALSFLGLFAINPTLTTIFDLQKQVDENKLVQEQLANKMNTLSSLQQQYTALESELPIVYDAIPKDARVPLLVGQIQGIAQQAGVTLRFLRVSEIPLTQGIATDQTAHSFTVSLEATGEYDALLNFASLLTNFSRIVTIDSITITKDNVRDALVLHVQSREYFKQ